MARILHPIGTTTEKRGGNLARAEGGELSAITWHPANRARHETDYPDRPLFTAAELADWSRIFKWIDIEHPKPGKNSFQALVGRQLVGADQMTRIAVYFVAYT